LLVYAKCQQIAETSEDVDAAAYHERFVRQSIERINRWADMANAALVFCEYQVNNGWDANVDGATYIRERGKLWDAFMESRAKAKGMGNEST